MTVLLFDIDNTLLDFDKAEYTALGKIFKHYHIADNPENRAIYSRENKALWRLHESGQMTRQELLSTRFVNAFRALNKELPTDGLSLDLEYESYLAQGHDLVPHAKELLDDLRQKEIEMYIVSNGTSKVSRPRIVESGIASYFREIFISEEVGAHKPSLEFFNYVFQHIEQAHQKDFAIVGDSLTTDMAGGQKAGIQTIWYNPNHLSATTIQPDYQIADLLEVEEMI